AVSEPIPARSSRLAVAAAPAVKPALAVKAAAMETATAVKAAAVKAAMEHAGPMGKAMLKPAMVENRKPQTNRGVSVIIIVVRVAVIIRVGLVILIVPSRVSLAVLVVIRIAAINIRRRACITLLGIGLVGDRRLCCVRRGRLSGRGRQDIPLA